MGCVRSCARATCTTPPKSSCYISKSTGPIVFKFGMHVEAYRLSDLQWSKVGASARAHVSRVQTPQKSLCYISATTQRIVLKFGTYTVTHQLRGLRQPKRGASARAHVSRAQPPPPQIPLLHLDNHTADCAEIWYARRDPSAYGFALVKGEMHPHVRTCHVHNPSQSHCHISTST